MFGAEPAGGLAALEAFQRDYLSPNSRSEASPSLVGMSALPSTNLTTLPPTPPRANSSSPAASFQPGSGSFEEQFKEVRRLE